jgi:two-component system phosphate regulon sensor histidine kinase PhoR
VETGGQQVWLRLQKARLRAAEVAELAASRLAVRRVALVVAAALTLMFVVAGGLSPRVALAGLIGVVALAAAWPAADRIGYAEARAAAQAQAESQRLWRHVVDAVPEPAVALNAAARIVHANRLAEEQFGAGRRGGHFASMSRDPGLLAAVEAALATRETQLVELHGRVPVERRLLATLVPLEAASEGRDAPTLLIVFRDFSEQDRLARMRADFVANASHELRTPLAYLKGSVETLLGPAKDDPNARAAFLKTMGEQAERMSRLVDDLLSLSRVEMREYLPPSGDADLAAVIADVAETLTPMAQQAGVSLILSGLDGEALVRGDHDELGQVFQNLIQNAIKYGRDGGKVEVRLKRDSGSRRLRYRVDVIDDGPGIAAQHLPRLTERFYRVNVAASRAKGGTGLGLAIVKHILNRHRGELAIASKLGEGSTFTVILPGMGE